MLAYYWIAFIFAFINLLAIALNKARTDETPLGILLAASIFVGNGGYLAMAVSKGLEAAILANNLIYFGGVMATTLTLLLICKMCRYVMPRYLVATLLGIDMVIIACVMSVGHSDIYYAGQSITQRNGITILEKVYGPFHLLFPLFLVLCDLACIALIFFSFTRKAKVSYRTVIFLAIGVVVNCLCYFGGRLFGIDLELTALGEDITMMLIVNRIMYLARYNVSSRIQGFLEAENEYGYIILDNRMNYVGCNELSYTYFPELKEQEIDCKLNLRADSVLQEMRRAAQRVQESDKVQGFEETVSGRILHFSVQRLYEGKRFVGYMAEFSDSTRENAYMQTFETYNSELQQMKTEAENANEAKTRFLVQMSHGIRTPITTMLGLNEMISRDSKDAAIREYAADIENAGNTLLEMVNRILDLSKIEKGDVEINRVAFETKAFLKELHNDLTVMFTGTESTFTLEVDPNLPAKLFGDKVRLQQVITNLVENELEKSSKANVLVKVRLEAYDVISASTVVNISVENLANRKSEIERDVLNNPFVVDRDEQMTDSAEGGLSLTMAEGLLGLMGSNLMIDDMTDGCIRYFSITLISKDDHKMGPFDANEEVEIAQKKSSIAEQGNCYAPKAKVLVVDDVEVNRKVLVLLLRKNGISAEQASGGEKCLEMVRKQHYDLIFMDQMMPGMDGVETLHKMRDDNLITSSTKVVVATADAVIGAREEYLAEGFDDYISKPIKTDELEEMLFKHIPEDLQEKEPS